MESDNQHLRLQEVAGDLEIVLKREDLIHPDISGNKWRKLKYADLSNKDIENLMYFYRMQRYLHRKLVVNMYIQLVCSLQITSISLK